MDTQQHYYMKKEELYKKIEKVSRLSHASKVSRLLHSPAKYLYAILLKNAIYPLFQVETKTTCTLFTGERINILLPASTDIYLTGGKSHASEIRLAKFLILNLNKADVFWDIGAHYGYFSLLASVLVGEDGQVVSAEASPTTFSILSENCKKANNIHTLNKAVSDKEEQISFYELPNLYAEYNSTDITQFEKERWFQKIKPKQVTVAAITLDGLYSKYKKYPNIIKIDVEGGELAVISGALNVLGQKEQSPMLVMEFLEPKRHNQPHKDAAYQLLQRGYQPHIIRQDGSIFPTEDIEDHLLTNKLESDNIVFKYHHGA